MSQIDLEWENDKVIGMSDQLWKRVVEYREELRDIALSTEPVDRDQAEKAVDVLYKSIGKPPPVKIWMSSPLGGALASAALNDKSPLRDQLRGQLKVQLGGQLGSQLWDQLRDQLRDQLWGQLGDQLGSQLWDQLRDQLQGQLYSQLGGQLGRQLGDQLGSQLGRQLGSQLGDQLRGQLGSQLWGQLQCACYGNQDLYWLGFYSFLSQELGLKSEVNPVPTINLAKLVGWYWPYENMVILTDRPKVLMFDDDRRLHAEHGPAIEYRDGWAVYTWHGRRVPSDWIEDKGNLNPELALTHDNAEMRRIVAEILGWERILNLVETRTIDKDPNPLVGELLEARLPDLGWIKFHKVHCPTGRTFVLYAKKEAQTALEAKAMGWGVSTDVIKNLAVEA